MLTMGVVGLGYWGPNLVRNIAASSETALAGICDLDEGRLEGFADQYPTARTYTDPRRMLDDPDLDAVAIATPVATHAPLARMALEAGKHVLVEKPLCATSEEGEELVELAATHDRVLMVDHVFVYSPIVQELRETVRSGAIGEPLFIDSVRINLGLIQHDVNVLWDLAPHDLSIIHDLVQRPPRSVTAVGSSHAHDALVDVAYLHVDYGDNLLASIHVNWLSPVKIRHFMIGGSRRSVLYNDLDPSEPLKIYDRGIDVGSDPEGRRDVFVSYRSGDVISPKISKDEPLASMLSHFVDCVRNGTPCRSGGAEGLQIVRLLEAADRSIANRGAEMEI